MPRVRRVSASRSRALSRSSCGSRGSLASSSAKSCDRAERVRQLVLHGRRQPADGLGPHGVQVARFGGGSVTGVGHRRDLPDGRSVASSYAARWPGRRVPARPKTQVYPRPHGAAGTRSERQRLPRQRRPDADRQVRRRARRRAGDGRSARPRSAPPSTARASRSDAPIDEVFMGQVLQAGAGQAPARQALLRGRARGHDPGHDDQPRLRLGPQGGHARGRVDQGGRRRRVRRGRHGVDERRAVPAAQGAVRLPAGQRDARGLRGRSTACGAASRTATWAPTPSGSRSATTSSRVDQDAFALPEPPAGGRGDRRRPVRRRDGAGHRSATRRAARRSSPSTRARAADTTPEALARLAPVFALPEGEDRGAATVGHRDRRQRARDHRRRRRRRSSRPSGRWSGTASRRSPGSWATRRPRSRRSGCSSPR